MITVYGIKTCDSVKKALKFFKEASIDINFVDFKQTKPTQEQVTSWAEAGTLAKLFNNRSRTYKDLGLSKLTLSDSDKIEWLQKEPLLVKRPVIEYKDGIIIGFDENVYQGAFQS